jgi:sugar/nucleoside kinase (ribokinase family)
MKKLWDVLGFGAIAVDEFFYVDHYPQIDEKVPIIRKQRQGGGNTATALVAVSRLGGVAAYCGVLGDDELSVYSLHELEREGVDISPTFRKTGAKPFTAIIIVDSTHGKRSILYSNEGVTEPDPEGVANDLIASCKVLFVDHQATGIGLHAARLAKNNHIPVVGDFEGKVHPRLLEVLALTDHLIVGVDFACKVTGKDSAVDAVRSLSNTDRACCVVTAGERGCWYSEYGGDICFFPAFHVKVVDTTGCGDVFHGAYAVSISRGESVLRAIKVATAAAGLKATQPGGRTGIPDFSAVEEMLSHYEQN